MLDILDEFYKAAKIRKLNAQEMQLIHDYAEQLHLDPIRVLVNKDLFDRVIEHYKAQTPRYDSSLITSLQEKLAFVSIIARRLHSTKDISENQKAKFYFDKFSYNPITLVKHYDTYNLWRIDLHRNMDMFRRGIRGYVIFEERNLIAYKFEATIEDILRYHEEKFLKIPHTDQLIVLAKRQYPRIEVDLDGLVKRVGKLRENPYYKCKICNISEGGVRICVGEDIFKEGEELEVKFKLSYEDIEAQALVKAKITYEGPGQYGLQFLSIDDHARFVIARYVQAHLNENLI